MKNRILFWIDFAIVHFGIAKHIQDKDNYELFAIYDVNPNYKNSFLNQKIVNFQKQWVPYPR